MATPQASQLSSIFINANHLRAVIPAAQKVGVYDISVINPDGHQATLPNAYTALEVESDDLFGNSYGLLSSPSFLRVGDSAQISLVVQREGGSQTLTDVAVDFYLGNPHARGALIGSATVAELPPDQSAITSDVAWSPSEAGNYLIVAVIDQANEVSEALKDNNIVSRTVRVLPAAGDNSGPTIDSFTIDGGAMQTTDRTVELSISASNPGEQSTAVEWLYLIEYEFNQSVRRWVPAQRPGWQSYQNSLNWILLPNPGLKYLQVWVADGAGNISRPRVAMINHFSGSDTLAKGYSHFYIYQLNAGQSMTARVTPSSGDPDLYVWSPQADAFWYSINCGLAVDEVSFSAPVGGIYIVEVYAYEASQYNLTVSMGATMTSPAMSSADLSTISRTVSCGEKTPQSVPGLAPDEVPEELQYAVPVIDKFDEPTAVRIYALEATSSSPTTLFNLFVVGLLAVGAYFWRRERERGKASLINNM